jgi:hypothetical protein
VDTWPCNTPALLLPSLVYERQVEVLGSDSRAESGAVKDGGKNPKWAQAVGSLTLPLPMTIDTSQATLRLQVCEARVM